MWFNHVMFVFEVNNDRANLRRKFSEHLPESSEKSRFQQDNDLQHTISVVKGQYAHSYWLAVE